MHIYFPNLETTLIIRILRHTIDLVGGLVVCLFLCVAAEMHSHQKAISIVKHISSSDTLKCEEGKKKASEREYSV